LIPKIDLNIRPKSESVICSLAFGDHKKLLNIMKPTVEFYAKKHDFDIVFITHRLVDERPVAWDKVVLIRNLLDHYSLVIWVDADTLIVNPNQNIKNDLDYSYDMHLCTHKGIEPCNPNTGVWVVRSTTRSIKILNEIWNQIEHIPYHPWEQGALHTLLGYTHNSDIYTGPTEYTDNIKTLDIKYNSLVSWDGVLGAAKDPVIVHYCGIPIEERIAGLRKSL
jgi:hypothetical protein